MRERPGPVAAAFGDPDQVEQLDRPLPGDGPVQVLVDLQRLDDLVPDGKIGVSEDIGSWKIMPSSRPRTVDSCRSSRPEQFPARSG